MAVGDVFQEGPTSIADLGFLDIQPAASIEWVIHNAYVPEGKAVEFYYYNGTDLILFDSDTAGGTRFNHNWHVTNTKYVRIKNVSGGAIFLAADGIVTK